MLSQRDLFLRYNAQTTDFPLCIEIEKAEGIYLYSPNGKKYIDLISGISVSNVGHRHPKVVNAIKNQIDKYLHVMVYGEFIQNPQNKLAEKLCEIYPGNFDNVYIVNSGSEANDGAIKLAKRFTKRNEVISFKNAYHGSSQGVLSYMGSEEFKRNYRPLIPGNRILNFNDFSDLNKISSSTACVIIEPVQAEAGIIPPEANFLQALREKCNQTGALLIFDEIQTGFGRTGTFFAAEKFNVMPDIVTLAKGMGGGMPIGAFMSTKKIMNVLKANPILGHITTFGGHPVSCAASLATIEVIENEQLLNQVLSKEKLFKSLLIHPKIKNVRSSGLLIGVEFENFETNKKIIDRCIEMGLITDWFLFNSHTMRIAPPLTITENQIKAACEIILKAI